MVSMSIMLIILVVLGILGIGVYFIVREDRP